MSTSLNPGDGDRREYAAVEREARIRRLTAEAAARLRVHVWADDGDPRIAVDAEELMTSDSDIRWWLLDRHPDETHLWNHPQSNGDQFFPVATVLLGIASCYVDREAT